jgi:hypothetical protein
MLKVLYDAANDAADEANEAAASDGIFDEDDDESLMTSPEMVGRARTFESLVLGTVPSTITWATLLRQMKSEINEIEYAQTPMLTSTRNIDLSKPFSLVPECFDSKTNVMRSLLIGCNYTGMAGAELKASHDDVRSIKVSLWPLIMLASRISFSQTLASFFSHIFRIILSMYTDFPKPKV